VSNVYSKIAKLSLGRLESTRCFDGHSFLLFPPTPLSNQKVHNVNASLVTKTTRSSISIMAKRRSLTKKKASPPPPSSSSSSEEEELGESSSDEEEEVQMKTGASNKMEHDEKDDDDDDDSDIRNDNTSDDDDSSVENQKFTDDNQTWLKPKRKAALLSDEDSNEESSDDEDEMLQVEKDAMDLDLEGRLEEEEAEAEMQHAVTSRDIHSIFHLPTEEEVLKDNEERVVAPSEIRARIEDIIEVLSDFKSRREPGKSRSEYMDRLKYDMSEVFGCLPELIELFLDMFNPTECLQFLDAGDTTRPLVIRTNTLKVRRKDLAQALMKRGIHLDPLAKWSKVGLKISESPVPVGATPEYLAGHYMLQSAASMCPVMALAPEPGERVMDMASAPGGKTSYLAQMMKNTGHILANDLKKERQKATVANLQRLGVKNAVTCVHDGRKLAKMANHFDRILLDAPCSGLGVISRDQSVKVQRTIKDIQRTAVLQKELLLAGIDALNHKSKTGGFIVYSTCSVSVAENEEVVNYVLGKRDVKIVSAGLEFGVPGFTRYRHKRFHPSLAETRRFYPHVHNMDGFYVAKIQKLSDKKNVAVKESVKEEEVVEENDISLAKPNKSIKLKNKSNAKTSKLAGKRKSSEKESNLDEEKKAKVKFNPRDANKAGAKRPMGIKKKRSDKVARLPIKLPKKKQTNAKVTKPRRMKVTS